jgi:hypothetical protein
MFDATASGLDGRFSRNLRPFSGNLSAIARNR